MVTKAAVTRGPVHRRHGAHGKGSRRNRRAKALSVGGAPPKPTLDVGRFPAIMFDMDGVITRSADCHGDLWKVVLDDFLRDFCERRNLPFRPFDARIDYHDHVDGKPRYDGVASFLASRGMMIPFGEPTDDEATETCCGLGNRKNRLFLDHLNRVGVEVYDSTVEMIRQLRERQLRIAVVSASKNAETVLCQAGLAAMFDVIVSGREAAELSLAGKPAPDTYVHAAHLLSIPVEETVVIEDSISGIQAARAANAGLIIGVDRGAEARALLWHGAHLVVCDLSELELG